MCVWAEERRETVEENERMVSESVKRVVYMMRVRERASESAGEEGGEGIEGREREGEDKGKRTLKMRKVCER